MVICPSGASQGNLTYGTQDDCRKQSHTFPGRLTVLYLRLRFRDYGCHSVFPPALEKAVLLLKWLPVCSLPDK